MERSIIRSYVEKVRASSTIIDNELLESRAINAISKIVLIQALKFSTSNKEVSMDDLMASVGLSRNTLRTHIRKLIDAGYCTKELLRDGNGKKIYKYSFYESTDKSRCYNPLNIQKEQGSPFDGSQRTVCDKPYTMSECPVESPYDYLAKGTQKREATLMSIRRPEEQLDYAIQKASEKLMLYDSTVSKELRNKVLYEILNSLPRNIIGTYEERKDRFYEEILNAAKTIGCGYEIAESFYAYWSIIEIEELKYMRFEMINGWKTINYLAMKMNKEKMRT